MPRTPLLRLLAVGAVAGLLLGSCSDDDSTASDGSTPPATEPATDGPAIDDETAEAVATTYADLVLTAYGDTIDATAEMQARIDELVAEPDEARLDAARDAWIAARELYGPTEVFRFYDGPIDAPETGPEGQINAWPLDEAYIDSIIADTSITEITPEVLVEANEQGGESNISTGWHAIEYLLWGADENADGPGDRPVTDYTTSPDAERRAAYLTVLAQLLVDDLTGVRDQWLDEDGTYRAELLEDPQQAIENILRGMGALSAGELAGERILVAYDTQDQEDEHSCFSDNTTADILGNARGIRLAYLADWPGVEGTSLSQAVAAVDPDLDAELRGQLEATVDAAEALPGPFDQMILGADDAAGRVALLGLGEDLQAQGDTIAEVGSALGYEISLSI